MDFPFGDVEGPLAAGASGVVLRARGEDGSAVALKVARPGADGRVGAEAALASRLARRWGPSVRWVGPAPARLPGVPAGALVVAYAWQEGSSLADALDAAGASARRAGARDGRSGAAETDAARRALEVAHGVARGLEELHDEGVAHGDVKPANVRVADPTTERLGTDAPAARRATLVDLDLAVERGGRAAGATPRYLAPERAFLDGPATAAQDVWALGVVIAECLAPELSRGRPATADVRARLAELHGEAVARGDRAGADAATLAIALLAAAPGARPSAAWVGDAAARALGLATPDDERVARRRERVARAYLAVQREAIASGAQPSSALEEPVSGWVAEACARRALVDGGLAAARGAAPAAARAPAGPEVGPLDATGRARWLVRVLGSDASAWPAATSDDATLGRRLLARAARGPLEATAAVELEGGEAQGDARSTATRARWALARGEPAAAAALLSAAARASSEADGDDDDDGAPPSRTLVAAEVARRRGDAEAAARLAAPLVTTAAAPGARALLARLAWDAGRFDEAHACLEGAPPSEPVVAEVLALLASAEGRHADGLAFLAGAAVPDDRLIRARLDGARGLVLHAAGRSEASLAAFERAAGAVAAGSALLDEATYLTGVAAAAVDVGAARRARAAALRAALLWERLDQPARAARAWLARGAAALLVGEEHEAREALREAASRAVEGRDARAGLYVELARLELPGAGPSAAELAALEARCADPDDVLRVVARAPSATVRARAPELDLRARAAGDVAALEWWGARARALAGDEGLARGADGRAVLDELVARLGADAPSTAPLPSRLPALTAAVALARALPGPSSEGVATLGARRDADVARLAAEAESSAHLPPWARRERGAPPVPTRPSSRDAVAQLARVAELLAGDGTSNEVLVRVLDAMLAWTSAERALVFLRRPDGTLAPRAGRNLGRADLVGEQRRVSLGLAARALETREVVSAADALRDLGDVHASVHALGLRSVLAVPLVVRGEALGVVYLDDRSRGDAFSDGDRAWVSVLAGQAASALAHARDRALLRRAARRAERARARLAEELAHREDELAVARESLDAQAGEGSAARRYPEITGSSAGVRELLRVLDRVGPSDVPVLVVGESGTGKELVARAIHRVSARARRPFVSESCAALPPTLLESTLFGHVRGAFTGADRTRTGLFELADGGTLFLDEVGELPLAVQAKLLRVLQEGEIRPLGAERVRRVDVRVVGATHRDLRAMVDAGTFREDLLYRLDVVTLRVPALRERGEDVPLLVAHFLAKHGAGRRVALTPVALERLGAYPWPGNVRELENEIRRALVLGGDVVDVRDLSPAVRGDGPKVPRGDRSAPELDLKARVEALEVELVAEALRRTDGNRTRAAEALGLSRFGLQKMLKRLGLG